MEHDAVVVRVAERELPAPPGLGPRLGQLSQAAPGRELGVERVHVVHPQADPAPGLTVAGVLGDVQRQLAPGDPGVDRDPRRVAPLEVDLKAQAADPERARALPVARAQGRDDALERRRRRGGQLRWRTELRAQPQQVTEDPDLAQLPAAGLEATQALPAEGAPRGLDAQEQPSLRARAAQVAKACSPPHRRLTTSV